MCIRVLHVVGIMGRGGTETLLMSLYRNMDPTIIQFDFMVHGDEPGDYEEEIEKRGGKVFRVPRYCGTNHGTYKKAWEFFFDRHPEHHIIHGHVRSTAAIYLSIARKYGRIAIAHSHNTGSRGNWLEKAIKTVYQLPIRCRADYFLACSEKAGEWLFGKKICKSEKFRVLNNGIELKNFIFSQELRDIRRKELGIEEKFVIGHVGNFAEQKNHLFLIDVFRDICDKDDNCVLMLIGGGSKTLKERVQEKALIYGIKSKVLFMGNHINVSEWLNAMDVFVFPSKFEGLGIAAIEAQANGLCCILSDTIPREVEVTKNVTFLSLCEPVECWASAIMHYKNGYKREDMWNQIYAKGYDIEETARWIKAFYLDLEKQYEGEH